MNPAVTSTLNLTLYAGISLVTEVHVFDAETNAAVNLTGCTARLQITHVSGDALLIETPLSDELLLDQEAGVIHIVLKPATTVGWSGTYKAFLDLTWPTGANARLVAGTWTYN